MMLNMLRDTDKCLNCVITLKKDGHQKDVVFGYILPSLTSGGVKPYLAGRENSLYGGSIHNVSECV
jgi:hypothetical protein